MLSQTALASPSVPCPQPGPDREALGHSRTSQPPPPGLGARVEVPPSSGDVRAEGVSACGVHV